MHSQIKDNLLRGIYMNNTSLAIPFTDPNESLGNYIRAVNKIPMLTAEEEITLAKQVKDGNDLEAAQRMIMSHLRFVAHVARGYSGYGLSQGSLDSR